MQDRALKSKEADYYDFQESIKNDYYIRYEKLEVGIKKLNYQVEYTIKRNNADMVNNIDLVLYDPEISYTLNQLVKRVDISVGGQRFDSLNVEDLSTQIKTTLAILEPNRLISYINGKLFVPLPMSLLYKNHGIPLFLLDQHDTVITVTFNENYKYIDQVELYGNKYFLDTEDRDSLTKEIYEFNTFQSQYCGLEKISVGVNTYKIWFNHLVGYIYFWGDFSWNDIENIKLCFNKEDIYYDGPLEPLIYKMSLNNFNTGSYSPIILKFTDTNNINKMWKSTYNMSRIDNSELIITLKEDASIKKDAVIHIVGLNMAAVRVMSGMMGLVYSK